MALTFEQKYFSTAGTDSTIFGITHSHHNTFVTGRVGVDVIDFAGNAKTLPATRSIFVAGVDKHGKQLFYKTAGSSTTQTFGSDITSRRKIYSTGIIREPDFTDFAGYPQTGENNPYVAALDVKGDQKFFVHPNINADPFTKIANNECRVFMGAQFTGTGSDLDNNPVNASGNPSVAILALKCNGRQAFFKWASGNSLGQISANGNLHYDDHFPVPVPAPAPLPTPILLEVSVEESEKDQKDKKLGNPDSDKLPDYRRVFVTGTVNLAPEQIALDFEGNAVSNLLPQESYAFVSALDNCGNQKYFLTAGPKATGVTVTNRGDVVYSGTTISGQGASDFLGLPIVLSSDEFVGILITRFIENAPFSVLAQGKNIILTDTASNSKGIFVTGVIIEGPVFDFNNNPVSLPSFSGSLTFVAGFTPDMTQTFFVISSGSSNAISASEKAVFVAGFVVGPDAFDYTGTPIPNLRGGGDAFAASLDFNGNQNFFAIAGGTLNDNTTAVTSHRKKGFFGGTVFNPATDFLNQSIVPKGQGDVFISALKL